MSVWEVASSQEETSSCTRGKRAASSNPQQSDLTICSPPSSNGNSIRSWEDKCLLAELSAVLFIRPPHSNVGFTFTPPTTASLRYPFGVWLSDVSKWKLQTWAEKLPTIPALTFREIFWVLLRDLQQQRSNRFSFSPLLTENSGLSSFVVKCKEEEVKYWETRQFPGQDGKRSFQFVATFKRTKSFYPAEKCFLLIREP